MKVWLGLFAAAVVCLSGMRADAATFYGAFWDASAPVTSLSAAQSVIDSGAPTATFAASLINYPRSRPPTVAPASATLGTFLGPDADSLTGAVDTPMLYSVFRFSGFVHLIGGALEYSVYSDDGFRLSVGGATVLSFDGLRGLNVTTDVLDLGAGRKAFELLFYENEGGSGVTFKIGGDYATPVPLPAPVVLLMFALVGSAFLWRGRAV